MATVVKLKWLRILQLRDTKVTDKGVAAAGLVERVLELCYRLLGEAARHEQGITPESLARALGRGGSIGHSGREELRREDAYRTLASWNNELARTN